MTSAEYRLFPPDHTHDDNTSVDAMSSHSLSEHEQDFIVETERLTDHDQSEESPSEHDQSLIVEKERLTDHDHSEEVIHNFFDNDSSDDHSISLETNSRASRRTRRRTVFLFSITTILLFADQNLLSPNLTSIANEFGFSDEERDRKLGGDIALAFFLVGAPASFLVGCLADQSDRSVLFAWTVGIGEGACFATFWTRTYTQLYVCRTITGFSVGGAIPLIYSVLGDLFVAEDRHAVSAIIGIGTGTGIAFGQGVAGFLGPTLGWRVPFLVVSIPALICAALVLFTVPDPERGTMERIVIDMQQHPKEKRRNVEFDNGNVEMEGLNQPADDDTSNVISDPLRLDATNGGFKRHESSSPSDKCQSQQEGKLQEGRASNSSETDVVTRASCGQDWRLHFATLASLLSCPTVLLTFLQGAPGCLPWGIVNSFLNDFLAEDRGMTVEGATMTVLCFGLGNFFGLVVGGAGGRHLYSLDPRFPAILAGSAAILGCIPFWLLLNTINETSPFLYIVVVTLLAGLGTGVTGPIVKATLQNVTLPTTRGQAFAIYNLFDDFGRGLGPVFVSLLIVSMGGRTPAFNLGVFGWVLCGILNLLIFLTVDRDERKTQAMLATSLHYEPFTSHEERYNVSVGETILVDGQGKENAIV